MSTAINNIKHQGALGPGAAKRYSAASLYLGFGWIMSLFCLLSLLVCHFLINDQYVLKGIGQCLLVWLIISHVFTVYRAFGLFTPLTFIPLAGLLYALFGGANIIINRGWIDHMNEFYFMLYYFGWFTGVIFSNSINPFRPKIRQWAIPMGPVTQNTLADIVIITGLTALAVDWIQIGSIPLLSGDDYARAQSKPILRMVYFTGNFVAIYKYVKDRKRGQLAIVILYVFLMVFSGYRAVLILTSVLLFYFFMTYSIQRATQRLTVIVLMLTAFFFINYLKLYRDITQFGEERYARWMDRIGLEEGWYWLSPILLTFQEGPAVFQILRDNRKEGDVELGYGSYWIENISTILPGEQLGYGKMVAMELNTIHDRTLTPTVIGPYYMDFGNFGVWLIGFLFGWWVHWLHSRAKKKHPFYITYYLVIASFFTIWTHGGSSFAPTFVTVVVILNMLKLVLLTPAELNRKRQAALP